MQQAAYKIPQSVLVVIYTSDLQVLILERADRPGFWQSVTGSRDSPDEPFRDTAAREVLEETGLIANQHVLSDWDHAIQYQIYPQWRHRYAPGVTQNTEHWFGLMLLRPEPVRLSAREHTQSAWLEYREAAQRCFSPSNSEAILQLPQRLSNAAR
jgi:dATP pyrophosphohydrolase